MEKFLCFIGLHNWEYARYAYAGEKIESVEDARVQRICTRCYSG